MHMTPQEVASLLASIKPHAPTFVGDAAAARTIGLAPCVDTWRDSVNAFAAAFATRVPYFDRVAFAADCGDAQGEAHAPR
jgi:hypothetical protein